MPRLNILTKDIDVLGLCLTMGSALDSSAPPSPIMLWPGSALVWIQCRPKCSMIMKHQIYIEPI